MDLRNVTYVTGSRRDPQDPVAGELFISPKDKSDDQNVTMLHLRWKPRMVKKLEWTEMAQVATIIFPVRDLLKYYQREAA